MAETIKKWIITTDTWIKGKPVAQGTVLELDPTSKEDQRTLGDLAIHDRIAPATQENIAKFGKSEKSAKK